MKKEGSNKWLWGVYHDGIHGPLEDIDEKEWGGDGNWGLLENI